MKRDASGFDGINKGPRCRCGVDLITRLDECRQLRSEQQFKTDIGRCQVQHDTGTVALDPTLPGAGTRLRRSDAALSRRTPRGVLISAPGAAEPVLITTPGEAVWSSLEAPCSRAELVATLAEAFGEDATVVATDIDPVLEALLAIGAVLED